jgi:hypothetical protein
MEELELGQKFETFVDKTRDPNKDTCIAVAGLPENNTVQVLKYCVPKMQGKSVSVAPLETWSVWYSDEWSSGIVSLHFADTVSGDTLIALRDNRGKSLESGHVLEDIVSVHPRVVQMDPSIYDRYYGNRDQRLRRFAYTYTSKMDVSGFSSSRETPLKITDIFVLPRGSGDERMPWIFMSYIVSSASPTDLTTSMRRDVCGMLDMVRCPSPHCFIICLFKICLGKLYTWTPKLGALNFCPEKRRKKKNCTLG